VEASKKYVDAMGGTEEVLVKARRAFDEGDYRWVAQLVNHVVFADPKNQAARELQADALEQLGYQAENGTWRNFYLTGAKELRNGVTRLPTAITASPDTISAMPPAMLFDYLAVRLNGPRAGDVVIRLGLSFTDEEQRYLLEVKDGVLNYFTGRTAAEVDASISLSRPTFDEILAGKLTLADARAGGDMEVEGRVEALDEFVSLLDTFEFWFNIVEP
jgi:alkyl sulfatase BDS1-like metallo-beta-lactamase superfamily hydrolase